MAELNRLILTLPASHTSEEADMLSALLALHVAHGWEEQSMASGELRCVVHSAHAGLCRQLGDALLPALPDLTITSARIKEENWGEAWKEFFTPVEAGERFLVLAPWMRREREAATRTVILIEPKMAFGTGHHATTALCLEALSDLTDAGLLRPGMRFLDLGTGSGILGIAAVKLGLSGEGLDIDPAAIDNAEENRERNGVAPEDFVLSQGSVDLAEGPYDMVVANILAGPLKDMAPGVQAVLPETGGLLILSGLLDIQAEDVSRVYTELGFPAPRRIVQGEWTALVFAPETPVS